MAFEVHVDERADRAGRALYRCADDTRFAYVRGQEWIRYSDGSPWAHRVDDRLMSVRSGDCLAIRVGNVYYDAESREPLYYEPA